MPANIGEMFYVGEMPWHEKGLELGKPATLEEALRAGGLGWQVGSVDLMTADDPPSPVEKRMALVRLDRPAGHEGRVLGVAHRGFVPVQNVDAGMVFDAIFGRGQGVYCTGGYLGHGEVIWLLAKIDRTITIGDRDVVQPYALMANSHDGSMAFNIRLTTVRVVCQNTLALAMSQKLAPDFRRSHQGSLREHADAAQSFFKRTMHELDSVAKDFVHLSSTRCSDETATKILWSLLPDPKEPRNSLLKPGLRKAWETRLQETRNARKQISHLRESGKGMDLDGSKGTLWGLLNAVLEYFDHHRALKGSRLQFALLGDGMDLKARAFREILEEARRAA